MPRADREGAEGEGKERASTTPGSSTQASAVAATASGAGRQRGVPQEVGVAAGVGGEQTQIQTKATHGVWGQNAALQKWWGAETKIHKPTTSPDRGR